MKSPKRILGSSLGQRPKPGPSLDFCHFLKFGLLFFLETLYNDSLKQCLTSRHLVEIKPTKKVFGTKFGPKRAKIRPKVRFFSVSPSSSIVQDFQRKIYQACKRYFNMWKSEKAQRHNRYETTTAIQPQSNKLKVLAWYVKNLN